MSKTWKITVDEYELKALIAHNSNRLYNDFSVERSHRIHDLTKRLNKKDDLEIEIEKEPESATENVKEVEVPAVWG